jgi:hypothetical protein
MIRSALLASVLAIVAAGCGDDVADCPSAVAQGTSCTSAGLSCFSGSNECTCTGGAWQCKPPDMSIVDHMDLSHLPTTD